MVSAAVLRNTQSAHPDPKVFVVHWMILGSVGTLLLVNTGQESFLMSMLIGICLIGAHALLRKRSLKSKVTYSWKNFTFQVRENDQVTQDTIQGISQVAEDVSSQLASLWKSFTNDSKTKTKVKVKSRD